MADQTGAERLTPSTAPAISCSDLWMVFGTHARKSFEAARTEHSDTTPADIAAELADKDLIPAVRNVSFDVKAGELFVIMGLSGSGKSTVIRCLSRLIDPTAGSVLISGFDILTASNQELIDLRRRKMGMVFQHFGLFPHMSVAGNVAFPLKIQGVAAKDRQARAQEVIELVGLAGREDAYPRQLSGGQRQRVGIARSLAVNPDIWFLDEPFSALDPLIRRQLQDEFLSLQSSLHKSIVFITHDIGEALKLADRIAIMRDGEIVQIGTAADIVLSPADAYVAEFARDIPRGKMMTLEGLITPLNGRPLPTDETGPPLAASMTLEAALTACAMQRVGHSLPVTDGDGQVVGTITTEQLARAIGDAAEQDSAADQQRAG
ncbi:MAG: betaine/proline/choline family ABC transporter ATP-binding protein [Pseudomonadota bacterium]